MDILVTLQGDYGQRMVSHLRQYAPSSWKISASMLPRLHLPVIDEPEDYLPADLPPVDLVLHLGESHQAAQLIPAIVRATGAQAVIAPVDHGHWLPRGLRRQLDRELASLGVSIVFPEPFCSLTETTAGFAPQVYHAPLISEFARRFGSPSLDVQLDESRTIIATVRVNRGSPCGSSHFAAQRLSGMPVEGITPRAGLICLHYPCLASMTLEERHGRIETLMHWAGQIFNDSLDAAISRRDKDSGTRS